MQPPHTPNIFSTRTTMKPPRAPPPWPSSTKPTITTICTTVASLRGHPPRRQANPTTTITPATRLSPSRSLSLPTRFAICLDTMSVLYHPCHRHDTVKLHPSNQPKPRPSSSHVKLHHTTHCRACTWSHPLPRHQLAVAGEVVMPAADHHPRPSLQGEPRCPVHLHPMALR